MSLLSVNITNFQVTLRKILHLWVDLWLAVFCYADIGTTVCCDVTAADNVVLTSHNEPQCRRTKPLIASCDWAEMPTQTSCNLFIYLSIYFTFYLRRM